MAQHLFFANRPRRDIEAVLSIIDVEVGKRRNTKKLARVLDRLKPELLDIIRENVKSELEAKLLTIKAQNLFLAKHHFLVQSASLLSKPYGLIVDPTNFCNLQCPGCVHSPTVRPNVIWPNGTLDADDFRRYIRHYGPFATQITFCNFGEPLLNRNTPAFIRAAKSYLTRIVLSTNLSVGHLDAEAYVESGLDFMILSIDGATQPVYETYRRNGHLEVVYQNIRNLVAAKRKLGRETPILHWQFLAFKHNEHEIPLAIEAAREIGVDEIEIVTPSDVSWDDPGILRSTVSTRLESFNNRMGQILNQNWNPFPEELPADAIQSAFATRWKDRLAAIPRGARFEPTTPSPHTCRWLYTNMAMDATCRVLPCCSAPSPEMDLVFGTFGASSNEDVFNSTKYRLSRIHFGDAKVCQEEYSKRYGDAQKPYCFECPWDHEHPNVSNAHLEQYLRQVGGSWFTAKCLQMLCHW